MTGFPIRSIVKNITLAPEVKVYTFFYLFRIKKLFLFKNSGGQPRLGVCPQSRKTVFNPATGQCDGPENVPGWYVNFELCFHAAQLELLIDS